MSNFPAIKSVYTDGACSGNPGPGGWGTVVYFSNGAVHEMGGGEAQTTNNRMELQAAIAALEFLQGNQINQPIQLFTDSEYVMKGITQWIHGWKKKGWKTAGGKAVLNQDLWQQLDRLNSPAISWSYVRGHSGNVGNERCDVIARGYSLRQPVALRTYAGSSAGTTAGSTAGSVGDGSAIASPGANSEKISAPVADATSMMADVTNRVPTPAAGSSIGAAAADTSIPDCYMDHGLSNGETVQSRHIQAELGLATATMIDASLPSSSDLSEELPREVRVAQLRNTVETLQMADAIATQGYLITSSELADLMDVNASAVTSRGDNWVWRNWVVSRVRREGNQILWQLERVD